MSIDWTISKVAIPSVASARRDLDPKVAGSILSRKMRKVPARLTFLVLVMSLNASPAVTGARTPPQSGGTISARRPAIGNNEMRVAGRYGDEDLPASVRAVGGSGRRCTWPPLQAPDHMYRDAFERRWAKANEPTKRVINRVIVVDGDVAGNDRGPLG